MMIRLNGVRPYLVAWNNVPYHPARTVFLINAKCANTSVKRALLKALGEKKKLHRPHRMTATWSPGTVARSGYRSIAVVRNPYARAVSLWHQKIILRGRSGLLRKGDFRFDMDFTDFLREVEWMDELLDVHVRSQWIGMTHRGRFLADMVIRIEDPGGWARVREEIPEMPALPRRNTSNAPDWRDLCTGEAGEIIRRRWARDFELFGYPR